ncbi:EAL domain-containing protein [Anaerobacillus sp. MEB173]|uniref:EAL domain-containing protein n=1 Tax=Anaerobacillus sp. MEB173 TaxID=3383345 RepID=UPI003F8EDB75
MSNNEKINILLVDDRSENLLALEAIIERDEYNIVKANSGEEALKKLLKFDFAAILLDVQMPGMDGFGTAKIIKAREKTKNIPILFITANNLESDHIFTGYSLGAIDYILKPFDPIILKAKVDRFVEMYKLNQALVRQTEVLAEKKRELEKAYLDLSKTTSELRVSEALANVISETSIDSMIIIDQDGRILKVNPAVRNMFAYKEVEMIGKHITMLFTCEQSQKYIQDVLGAINNLENIIGHENSKELSATRKGGHHFPIEIQIGKRFVQGKCIVACTIRDITSKKQHEEMIIHMAYHDRLTDLPNRRKFNDQLASILNKSKQTNQTFAMMYLDMDRFKYINDSLGHYIGDKLLLEIATRLKNSVRQDDFIARVGGDEFNIILPDTNREIALEIAENILELFKQPFYVDNYELFVTICIGISVFPYDGEESIVLMKSADAALYRAKEQGRNKYKMFHSGMNIQSFRAFTMQTDLRKAIERGELSLVYQPQLELETGRIESAEALLRWNHPNWGTILPAEFIPLAEETGFIVDIGQWVMNSVCRQLREWCDKGMAPIRIAVNFSTQQLLQKDMVEKMKQTFLELNVSPTMLEIEISEAAIMGNETVIVPILTELRKIGIKISIDHFGVGYTSFHYLRKFPVDTLKIDKSFVQDIANADSNVLIATFVSLAQNLHMSVIAEGVETETQLEMLRKNHCQAVQGHLISPPIPAVGFASFVATYKQPLSNRDSEDVMERTETMIKDSSQSVINNNEEILALALGRAKKLYAISTREMDVFKLIVNGLSNKEISEKLCISEHTVKNHITHILQKLDVTDRMQAMAMVYQLCIEEGKSLSIHSQYTN